MSIERRPRLADRFASVAGAWPKRPAGSAMVALALALVTAPIASSGARADEARPPLEYQVKAAYLFKFLPFVAWPALPAASRQTFGVCILGDAPFGAELEEFAQGQQIDGRPLSVRRLSRVSRTSGCHVLYLGERTEQSPAEALRNVQGTPCLTVSEDDSTDDSVIQFRVRDHRVRFSVNLKAANQNGLTLSSKLLNLALFVRKGSTP
jgi:hypothetical protein